MSVQMLRSRLIRQSSNTFRELSLRKNTLNKQPSLPSFNSYINLYEKDVSEELQIENVPSISLPSLEDISIPTEELFNPPPPPVEEILKPKITSYKPIDPIPKYVEKKGLKSSEASSGKKMQINGKGQSQQGNNVIDMLNELKRGNNLEKFLESNGLSTAGISVPQLKAAFDQFLSKQTAKQKEIAKWEQKLNDLKELTDDKKLEKWLESLGVPASKVSIPLIKSELKRYFEPPTGPTENGISHSHKTLEEPHWGKTGQKDRLAKVKIDEISPDDEKLEEEQDEVEAAVAKLSQPEVETFSKVPPAKTGRSARFARAEPIDEFKGRSLIYQENTIPQKLWNDFKEMSPAKQVAIVVGITVVTAAVGFVSWRIFMMALPAGLSMNGYWTDVFAQWFIQRQDTAYTMLIHTAENAKPLSHTWANQYILWKYI